MYCKTISKKSLKNYFKDINEYFKEKDLLGAIFGITAHVIVYGKKGTLGILPDIYDEEGFDGLENLPNFYSDLKDIGLEIEFRINPLRISEFKKVFEIYKKLQRGKL